ncbi:MAG: heavy-metal-associated domain-containing protein [Flavobacteriales bacterium]|nr:heavy-metal-associated domain-containing protein [Flavobacteriales bacterium]
MDNSNITLPLLDVNSPHCALRVKNAIHSVPSITAVEVDLNTHSATLHSTAPAPAVQEAVTAIRQAGYQVATEQPGFATTGMTCGGCAKSAANILRKLRHHSARVDRGQAGDREVVKGTDPGRPACRPSSPPAIVCCRKPHSAPPS